MRNVTVDAERTLATEDQGHGVTRKVLSMPIDTLDPVREAARELPRDWLDRAVLPPTTITDLKSSRKWRDTPHNVRRDLVSQAQDVPELFVLWKWEPDAALRAEIVMALGRADDVASSNAALKTIFREETPDEGGQAVRREVKRILSERAEKEAQVERASGS